MREKKRWLIITFHTTAAAIAMEKLCRAKGLPGRLIPVPRELTADCGMSWRAEVQDRAALAAQGIPSVSQQGGGFYRSTEITLLLSLLTVIDNPRQDVPLIAVLRSPLFGFSAKSTVTTPVAAVAAELSTFGSAMASSA